MMVVLSSLLSILLKYNMLFLVNWLIYAQMISYLGFELILSERGFDLFKF